MASTRAVRTMPDKGGTHRGGEAPRTQIKGARQETNMRGQVREMGGVVQHVCYCCCVCAGCCVMQAHPTPTLVDAQECVGCHRGRPRVEQAPSQDGHQQAHAPPHRPAPLQPQRALNKETKGKVGKRLAHACGWGPCRTKRCVGGVGSEGCGLVRGGGAAMAMAPKGSRL